MRSVMEDNSCPELSTNNHRRSENFEVKGIQNSARHTNPHFANGSSPSYALPTIASQIRLSLMTESFSPDSIPICNRYKTPLPICRHQGRPLSGNPTDALETKSTSKKPDSAPAGNKSSTGTSGSTPVQILWIKNCNKGDSRSRPSSAKSCSSVSGPAKRNLSGKERNSSSQHSSLSQRLKEDAMAANPSRCSTLANESEVSSSADKHSKKGGTDRPRSVDAGKGFPGDGSSMKSDKSFAKTNDVSSSEKPRKNKELGLPLRHKKDDKKVLTEKSKHLYDNENTDQSAASGAQLPGSSVLDKAADNSVNDKVASKVDKVKSSETNFTDLPVELEHKLNSKKEFSEELNEKCAGTLSRPNSESDDAKETSSLKSPNVHDKNAMSNSGKMKQVASSGKPTVLVKRPKSKQLSKDSSRERESTKCPALNSNVESVDRNGCKKEPAQQSSHHKPNQKSSQLKTSMHEKEAKHSEDVVTSNTSNEKEAVVDEYKAKLAENRKLARAKAEHEAEEDRLKQEEIRIAEMERKRREEEEERKRDEEELRLAEESRRLEEERYRKSVEETELRRRLEAEQAEAEAKAKLEQQRLAREEAEKIEKERLEKQKREDKEKMNRKKRLEEIMKRVKTDEPEVEYKITDNQLLADDAATKESVEGAIPVSDLETAVCPDAVTQVLPAGESKAQFKSPLLQQILAGKSKVHDVKNIFNVEAKDVNGTAKEVRETSKMITLAARETDLLTEETNGAGEEVSVSAESDAGPTVETFGRAKETKNCLSEDVKTASEQSQLILQP